MQKRVDTPPGSVRVTFNGLKAFEKTKAGWKASRKEFFELKQVVKLFKAEGRLAMLRDPQNPRFLKGQLSPESLPQGARIPFLPNGEKLEKSFSLFAPHLQIHDQSSHDHWDVLYQNKGGTWSYVYTRKKRQFHQQQKYQKVEEFEKRYTRLVSNVKKSLSDNKDFIALPIYTLLSTYMRVGNETYYKAHGHAGLTTLTKKNISLRGNIVTFDYVGKDGVPIKISQEFLPVYCQRLKAILATKREDEFVFSKNGSVLHENDFKAAFRKYCGKEFYPHIVRSHYATQKVKHFLLRQKNVTKEKVEQLFISLAHDLGHRKFDKKKQEWKEHYAVTIHSYVQPELIEKVEKLLH
ncbi:hypothetical protein HYT55_03865 [Candidatus Woesearchaeota archaeon]|nr:hypothetical protein [Candidatus Woesearchaeota archaeon]